MDKKHKKKVKRAAKKKKDKARARQQQEQLGRRMNMFDRLPDKCSACGLEFPKTREAHMTWQVVVREQQKQVSLFCPSCQEKVKDIVENNNEV